MLRENPQTIRENTGILLEASKEIGLEVNPEKTKYMIMSRDQNIVRNGNIKIGNLSFEEVEKFKYLGATVTNINDIREEIKQRINMGNACYYSVEKLLSSSLLSKNLKVRIYKTVILPVVLYGCETWSLTLREEHRLRVFENKGKGELSVDMLNKLRDFSRKLTLFLSQFREGNKAYFPTIETARDEAMLNDYVRILIEIQNEFNSRLQICLKVHTCGVTVSESSREISEITVDKTPSDIPKSVIHQNYFRVFTQKLQCEYILVSTCNSLFLYDALYYMSHTTLTHEQLLAAKIDYKSSRL
ncbi:hypothetical protein ANN_00897 [Periplaneta americana]|uniref:Reverse transcriptase domain-containing protein n=1 Tax=Periplaneta americana TaxID=6978 RepID=A0ABQ8TTV3_PERAM|nr:hypothetical protein ANN_00897 [Periplaneta americana]